MKLCCVSIKILKLLSNEEQKLMSNELLLFITIEYIVCLQLTQSNGTKWFMVKILGITYVGFSYLQRVSSLLIRLLIQFRNLKVNKII